MRTRPRFWKVWKACFLGEGRELLAFYGWGWSGDGMMVGVEALVNVRSRVNG